MNLQYLLLTPFKSSTSKGLLNNVASYHSSKHPRHSSEASSKHSSKYSSQNLSNHSSKRSSKHSSNNSNNNHELNVSKSENYSVVIEPSNLDNLPNPHSVAVPSDAVKNDTRSPQEILAHSILIESFDPANYSNNKLTTSSLSSSAFYLAILERRKTPEHALLEAKLVED